jgi:hypothetical protein
MGEHPKTVKSSDSKLEIRPFMSNRHIKKADRLCRICVLHERYCGGVKFSNRLLEYETVLVSDGY